MMAWSQNRPGSTPALTSRSWRVNEPSASVAAPSDSWMDRGGTFARTVCLAYRQSGSVGFSSGQVVGSQRNSKQSVWAHRRLFPAVGGALVEEEHDVPPPPVAPDRQEEPLDRHLVPPQALAEQQVAALRVHRAVENVLRPIAGDGHFGLLPLQSPGRA